MLLKSEFVRGRENIIYPEMSSLGSLSGNDTLVTKYPFNEMLQRTWN